MGSDSGARPAGRAGELIERLSLIPHPEGGYYVETFRSERSVDSDHGRRDALTEIYFMLVQRSPSRFHRHPSDEIWHFLEGDPLELLILDPSSLQLTVLQLRGDGSPERRKGVVEGDFWQAARVSGEYALVSCTVAPGFEFSGLEMLRDHPRAGDFLREHPDLSGLV